MENSNDPFSTEQIGALDSDPFSTADFQSIKKAIKERRTIKVLGQPQCPRGNQDAEPKWLPKQDSVLNDFVRQAIADSGWAPFHYDRKMNGIPEPWRYHVLWRPECLYIRSQIHQWFDDVKTNNKTTAMLAACGALVLVNWLPQFGTGSDVVDVSREKQVRIDQEHMAATSAAIQNLLLLLTARNLGTYWSSGGLFRTDTMFEKLGIEKPERLLGAIFIDYGLVEARPDGSEKIPGKNRDARTNYRKWTREIVLDSSGGQA